MTVKKKTIVIDEELKDELRKEVKRSAERYIKDYLGSAVIGFLEDEIKKVISEAVGDGLRPIIIRCLKEKLKPKPGKKTRYID